MPTESPKRTRGRPKTFDRAHALGVAIDGYWRDGVESVSVNEICRRAGVSKPSLYREFGSEDELMNAALTHYAATVVAMMLSRLRPDRPLRETLDALIDFATREASPEMPAGCLLARMWLSRRHLGPLTRMQVERLRAEAVAAYEALLERCARVGDVVSTAPIPTLAAYVDAKITVALNRIAAGDPPGVVREHARLAFTVLTGPRA
jgi:AcrR family transcriptional regulator